MDAIRTYDSTVANVNTMPDLTVHIRHRKETFTGCDRFLESSVQTLRYRNMGTKNAAWDMEQSLTIGDIPISLHEQYYAGTGYVTVNGSSFCAQLPQHTYKDRYIPAAPIEAQKYSNVTAITNADTVTLYFRNPTAPESWLHADDWIFLNAKGSATLDLRGKLLMSEYSAAVTLNGTYIRHTVAVEIDYGDKSSFDLPTNLSGYTQISYFDGPRLLETGCGYILSSQNTTSVCESSISFEGFGDIRKERIFVNMSQGAQWSARMDSVTDLSNTSRSGDITQIHKKELFVEGRYTHQINQNTPAEQQEITQEIMQKWCQDILLGTALQTKHISDTSVLETDSTLRISFCADAGFAKYISENTFLTLYDSAMIFDGTAQEETSEAYIELSKFTGLPTAAGIHYCGTYELDGIHYTLTARSSQTYTLASAQAYQWIYAKTGADQAPVLH